MTRYRHCVVTLTGSQLLGLTKKDVHVQFVKENLTFTDEDSPISNLLLSLLGRWPSLSGRESESGSVKELR
jgi:hypothetical protein